MTGAVILALAPIALLIGLGQGMRRVGFLADAFWPQAERLSYYVLLPALFLHSLATAQLGGVPVASFAAALLSSTLAGAAVLAAARPLLGVSGPAFTSVFQGGVRFNSYVGVTAAAGLFGAQGVALAAVATAAMVPVVNVLCVLVFARFGAAGRLTVPAAAGQVARNPLILGDAVAPTFLPLNMQSDLKNSSAMYARDFTVANPHRPSALGCARFTFTNLQ